MEVTEKLQKLRRERIESGRFFEDKRFGDEHRADQALITDLRTVRRELLRVDQLLPRYAHSLIGRSIFIRYLEDRGILTEDYYRQVARERPAWLELLEAVPDMPYVDPEMAERLYVRVLSDKDFTYALFGRLARDFNGDMFPDVGDEKKAVTSKHLKLLQRFLRGNHQRRGP